MGLLSIVILNAALQGQPLAEDFFETRVRPVLAEHCYPCHTEAKTGGLRVDSREALLTGGKSGPALVSGRASESLLVRAMRHDADTLKMPPTGKIAEEKIAAVERWIAAGATWPAHMGNVAATKPKPWGLAPLGEARGSIDLLAGQKGKPVSRAQLVRRLYFDLTGLPPSFEEIREFERGGDTGALVDRLLASPAFGEKWARHWLDVARYAEDDVRGLGQASYPNAFRYRDWVVSALNEDLPYDEFIRLQIAADLLPRAGRDDRAALGLFGLGPWYYSNAPPPEARADERHDRVDVLTRGFLGLTVACARCHDHKFDPIGTKEYYALAGVFARTQYTEIPLADAGAVAKWDAHQARIAALEKAIQEFEQQLAAQLAEILAADTARFLMAAAGLAEAGELNIAVIERWKKYLARTQYDHPFLAAWKKEPSPQAAAAFEGLVREVMREKKEVDADNEAALAPTRPKRNAPKTRLPNGFATYDEFCPGCAVEARSLDRDRFMLWRDLFRPGKNGGVFAYEGEELETFLKGEWKRHLLGLRADLAEAKKTLPEQYAYLHAIGERENPVALRVHQRGNPYLLGDPAPQRFLEICGGDALHEGSGRKQLAQAVSRSPLAARVAVNRIWGELMGAYLVASPSNFGALGEKPANVKLLEYLAARFASQGYSRKKLIREIALAKVYQAAREPRRLSAEQVRDAMLAVSGLLDAKVGGPSVDLSKDRARRSVYGRISRFRLEDSLVIFDFPSPSITSEKRNTTQVPQQQLFLLNSPFVTDIADAVGRKARDAAGLYRAVLGRNPTVEERARAEQFTASDTLAGFAQVLLSSNEFLFVD
ncbi:MAG: PSD1 domain-containing protein [Bryobacterales bacterium]|nr:PSD1 domain-containing protein [Bryobacterales bacterium]